MLVFSSYRSVIIGDNICVPSYLLINHTVLNYCRYVFLKLGYQIIIELNLNLLEFRIKDSRVPLHFLNYKFNEVLNIVGNQEFKCFVDFILPFSKLQTTKTILPLQTLEKQF